MTTTSKQLDRYVTAGGIDYPAVLTICDEHNTPCVGLITTSCGWNLHPDEAIEHMANFMCCQPDEVEDVDDTWGELAHVGEHWLQ